MKIFIHKYFKTSAMSWFRGNMNGVLVVTFLLIFPVFVISAPPEGELNIVEEHENCDRIIPKFIAQIMTRPEASCEEPGEFPKPGNCTIFFKCVLSDGRFQPIIEYCATGYIFVHGVCVPNANVSDCPQFTCRIPDAGNQLGNEIELGDDPIAREIDTISSVGLIKPISAAPLISTTTTQIPTTSTTAFSANDNDNMSSSTDFTTMEPVTEGIGQSEQLKLMVKVDVNKNSSSRPLSSSLESAVLTVVLFSLSRIFTKFLC